MRSGRLTDGASAVIKSPICCGADLCSYPHLWPRAVGPDQKNEIMDTRYKELPLRDRVRSSVV